MSRLAAAVVLLLVACGADEDPVRGENTGPVPACSVDPIAYLLKSGVLEGRFAFSNDDPITFPVTVQLDIDAGTFTGTLAFADSGESYHADVDGVLDPGAALWGRFEATGSEGTEVSGAFVGNIDGRGGCGTWENGSLQAGPWRIGTPGPGGVATGGGEGPLLVLPKRVIEFFGCTTETGPYIPKHETTISIGNAGNARLEGSVEVVGDFLELDPSLGSFSVEAGGADVEATLRCTGLGEGAVLVHSNDLTPTVAIKVSGLPQSAGDW